MTNDNSYVFISAMYDGVFVISTNSISSWTNSNQMNLYSKLIAYFNPSGQL